MHLYKLNDTTKVIPIFMADSTAPLNGKTGLTLAVTLSKNGAAFVAAAGSVTETAGGNYYLTPTSVDSGTLGPMNMRATSAGAVDFNTVLQVVSFDPYSATNLGLSNLDATVSSRSTYAGTDTSGTTTLLSRVTGPVALASQIPANFTAATFASAGVFATAALVNAPTGGGGGGGIVTGYAAGQDPATLLLTTPANKLATDASGRVTADVTQLAGQTVTAASGVTFPASIGTSTYAGGAVSSVTGNVGGTVANVLAISGVAPTFTGTNINANSAQVGGQTASASGTVTFPASIGTSTYAGTDTSGTTTLLSRVTGPVALASQIPANFTAATFASAGVFATAALVNAPTGGGGGGGIVTGYAAGQDPATLLLTTPANKLATDASGRVTLAPAGLDAVTTEAGVNHRQAQALILAACTSICTVPSGTGTVNFKNAAGTQRIAVVVDGAGNRTAVTYSPPA